MMAAPMLASLSCILCDTEELADKVAGVISRYAAPLPEIRAPEPEAI